MRAPALLLCLLLVGCGSPPAPVAKAPPDPTAEPWYSATVKQLADLNQQARSAFKRGKRDDAASLIGQGEDLSHKLLSVIHSSLAALQAASDLDQLYGEMLLANRHYGWARLSFQKNVARWKHWKPQNPDTAERLKIAEAQIAECDRKMSESK
jgi:hypothetical protein